MTTNEKSFKQKFAKPASIATTLAAAALLTGCGQSDKEKWEESPGTNGSINLRAVKKAFQKYPSVENFEQRINEIFEGDNLIMLKVKTANSKNMFEVFAYEDLNENKSIDEKDDVIFVLKVQNGIATLEGKGVNAYYKDSWAYNAESHRQHYRRNRGLGFFFWYTAGRYSNYYTPRNRYDDISKKRSAFRNSSAFASQVNSNCDFEQKAAKKYGSSFTKSARNTSFSRKSYIATGFSSSTASRKSGWSTRKTFSKSRSSSRFRSFRGSSGVSI